MVIVHFLFLGDMGGWGLDWWGGVGSGEQGFVDFGEEFGCYGVAVGVG